MVICGVTRDNSGRIEIAFARSIGDFSVLVKECMSICEEIRIKGSKKIRNMKVESNVMQVIKVIIEKFIVPG